MLNADKATAPGDTHAIFSAECASATNGPRALAEALHAVARHTGAPHAGVWVCAVDTLRAGDALHGGFTLVLAEGAEEAAAVLKR